MNLDNGQNLDTAFNIKDIIETLAGVEIGVLTGVFCIACYRQKSGKIHLKIFLINIKSVLNYPLRSSRSMITMISPP